MNRLFVLLVITLFASAFQHEGRQAVATQATSKCGDAQFVDAELDARLRYLAERRISEYRFSGRQRAMAEAEVSNSAERLASFARGCRVPAFGVTGSGTTTKLALANDEPFACHRVLRLVLTDVANELVMRIGTLATAAQRKDRLNAIALRHSTSELLREWCLLLSDSPTGIDLAGTASAHDHMPTYPDFIVEFISMRLQEEFEPSDAELGAARLIIIDSLRRFVASERDELIVTIREHVRFLEVAGADSPSAVQRWAVRSLPMWTKAKSTIESAKEKLNALLRPSLRKQQDMSERLAVLFNGVEKRLRRWAAGDYERGELREMSATDFRKRY